MRTIVYAQNKHMIIYWFKEGLYTRCFDYLKEKKTSTSWLFHLNFNNYVIEKHVVDPYRTENFINIYWSHDYNQTNAKHNKS